MTIYWDRLPPGDQWDQHMLEKLLSGGLYPHGVDIQRVDLVVEDCGGTGIILFIPGRYWAERTNEINDMIEGLEWVLALRTSDESDWFDVTRIHHDNIRWWVQNPRVDREYPEGTRFIGCGFPAHFDNLPTTRKDIDVFLSAQNNTVRRNECFETLLSNLHRFGSYHIAPTPGFTQGIAHRGYAEQMSRARVAPAPAGIFTPDTFRFFEALEAHAIPIADDVGPNEDYDSRGYWRMLFPDYPGPVLLDYESLPGYIAEALEHWPANVNHVTAWWMKTKRRMAHWLVEDLKELGAI